MGLRGMYYSQTDMDFINSINAELLGDIIENLIQIFKVSPTETKTNIYGEASAETGKWYLPGIQISSLIERADMTAEYDDFGPSRNQSYIFKLREKMCIQLNFYPEIGDIVSFNDRYYEITNVVQEQLLGGQPDKSHSIICHGNYTRLSNINIVERNPS